MSPVSESGRVVLAERLYNLTGQVPPGYSEILQKQGIGV